MRALHVTGRAPETTEGEECDAGVAAARAFGRLRGKFPRAQSVVSTAASFGCIASHRASNHLTRAFVTRRAQKWPAGFGNVPPRPSTRTPMPRSLRQRPRNPVESARSMCRSSPVPSSTSKSPKRKYPFSYTPPGWSRSREASARPRADVSLGSRSNAAPKMRSRPRGNCPHIPRVLCVESRTHTKSSPRAR